MRPSAFLVLLPLAFAAPTTISKLDRDAVFAVSNLVSSGSGLSFVVVFGDTLTTATCHASSENTNGFVECQPRHGNGIYDVDFSYQNNGGSVDLGLRVNIGFFDR